MGCKNYSVRILDKAIIGHKLIIHSSSIKKWQNTNFKLIFVCLFFTDEICIDFWTVFFLYKKISVKHKQYKKGFFRMTRFFHFEASCRTWHFSFYLSYFFSQFVLLHASLTYCWYYVILILFNFTQIYVCSLITWFYSGSLVINVIIKIQGLWEGRKMANFLINF